LIADGAAFPSEINFVRPEDLASHLEGEHVRPMIVASDVERHPLFSHAIQIEIRVKCRRVLEDGAREI
jgi:hypothetical protein